MYPESAADTVAQMIIGDLKITHVRIYPQGYPSDTETIVEKSLENFDRFYKFPDSDKYVWDYWKEKNPDMLWICSYGLNRISGPVLKDTVKMRKYCDTISTRKSNVSVTVLRPGIYTLSILGANGEVIREKKNVVMASGGSIRFPIRDIASGVYFLRPQSGENLKTWQFPLIR